jgi:hypothetical protein
VNIPHETPQLVFLLRQVNGLRLHSAKPQLKIVPTGCLTMYHILRRYNIHQPQASQHQHPDNGQPDGQLIVIWAEAQPAQQCVFAV